MMPPSLCGHSGATGAGFTVIKATAEQVDQAANDLYIQTAVNATTVLPGPLDLACQKSFGQYGPMFAWAPRIDLPSIEGTIPEDSTTHFFIDLTGFCDTSGGNSKLASMFAIGLGLNAAPSGLPNGIFGFVTDKFTNLQTTISDASPQISPSTVTTTIQNYVTQSQQFFDNDYRAQRQQLQLRAEFPCTAQVILNGHEYVACQSRKAGIGFTKEGNCFTAIADTAGFAKIAATLSEQRAVGRLSEVCERWIYRCCLCFALDFEEQKRSGFRYHFSNYQMEYSRNLIFLVGGRMEQVFQALIDRSRAPLDLKTIKTILGDKGRPKYRPRNMKAAEWEVAVERPTYDLTVFKLHCGKLALKIYSKGERVLRIEAVAHNIREFNCGRLLDNFPEIVRRLKGMLEQFMQALSCIDQCFIGDEMLERLPLASRVGKSMVGGIDLNKPRLRHVAAAVIALSASPDGFTASALADQVRAFGDQSPSAYGPRQAVYDLKKLRGKDVVQRIGSTRRYEVMPSGLRAITALLVLQEKAIKPMLAAAQDISSRRGRRTKPTMRIPLILISHSGRS